MISIREAGAADHGPVEAVRRASWRAAYAGLIAPEHIERATSGPSRLSRPRPWRRTLVALAGEPAAIVGYASYGPERAIASFFQAASPPPGSGGEASAPEGPPELTAAGRAGEAGEVYALYVDPAWWSAGVGRALMSAALAALAAAGYQRAVLWVLAGNGRARRFYEIAGFSADGAVNVLHGLGDVLEVRYARPLQPGHAAAGGA